MEAVWGKGLLEEKNIQLVFAYRLTAETGHRLQLAASNLYRLFLNGKLAGYGPARAAHGYSRQDSYDLSPWAGTELLLEIEVYSGNVNTYYTVDEPPFFAAALYRGEALIARSADFEAFHITARVQKVQRYSYQRGFVESYRMGGEMRQPIETEAVSMNQLLPRYVSYPALSPIAAKMIETGTVTVDPDAEVPRDRYYTDIDPVLLKGFMPQELTEDVPKVPASFRYTADVRPESGVLSALAYRLWDFSRTVTGFFSLQVQAEEETELYILFDEVLAPEGTGRPIDPHRARWCNMIKYVLSPGQYDLLSFEAYSARYAAVVVTKGQADISGFSMVRYENPDVRPLPDYGDPALNQIVRAAAHTFAQNAVDILTDCPSRERAGWLCDTFFSGRAEAFFTGSNKVEKSFLENYALYRTQPGMAPGMLPMCYPADHPNGLYIPNWTMWYILELEQYVNRTGDEAMKVLSENKVRGLLEFFKKYENELGLLEDLEGWVFIEWSKCNAPEYVSGINFPTNMLWAAALEAAARLYGWQALTEKAQKLKAVIRSLSWNGTFFEDNMLRDENGKPVQTGHTTETAQYYAFYFGIAAPESHPTLWKLLQTQFGPRRDRETVYPTVYPSNAIVGNYLRLELLIRYGYPEQVLQECKDFFTPMAQLTGTLWEHNRLSASLNHGFASIAAQYIHECTKPPAL